MVGVRPTAFSKIMSQHKCSTGNTTTKMALRTTVIIEK